MAPLVTCHFLTKWMLMKRELIVEIDVESDNDNQIAVDSHVADQ